ncbi:MAG: hypothetical protein ACOYJA_07295 [Christensenellales bacterium]|jgi:hypothetical protein
MAGGWRWLALAAALAISSAGVGGTAPDAASASGAAGQQARQSAREQIPPPERIDLYDAAADRWLSFTPDTEAYQGLLARTRARVPASRWTEGPGGTAGKRCDRVYTYTGQEDAQMLRDSGRRFVQLVYDQPRARYGEAFGEGVYKSPAGEPPLMDRIMMPLGDVPESLHEDLAGQMIYLKEDLVLISGGAYQDTEPLGSPDELAAYVEALYASAAAGGERDAAGGESAAGEERDVASGDSAARGEPGDAPPEVWRRAYEAIPAPDAIVLSRAGREDKVVASGQRDYMWLMQLIRQRLPKSGRLAGRAASGGAGGALAQAGERLAGAAWLGELPRVTLRYDQPVDLGGVYLSGDAVGPVDAIVLPLLAPGRLLYFNQGRALYACEELGPPDGLLNYLRDSADRALYDAH